MKRYLADAVFGFLALACFVGAWWILSAMEAIR